MDPREALALEERVLRQVRQILAARDKVGSEALDPDSKLAVQQLHANLNGLKDSLRVTNTVVEDLSAERQKIGDTLKNLEQKLNATDASAKLKAVKDSLDVLKTQLEADTVPSRVKELEQALAGLAPRVLEIERGVAVLKHHGGGASQQTRSVVADKPEDSQLQELRQTIQKQELILTKSQTVIEYLSKQIETLTTEIASVRDYATLTSSACLDSLTAKISEAKLEVMDSLNKQTIGMSHEIDRRIQLLVDEQKARPAVDLTPFQTKLAALEAKLGALEAGKVTSSVGMASIGSSLPPNAVVTTRLDSLEARVKTLEAAIPHPLATLGNP